MNSESFIEELREFNGDKAEELISVYNDFLNYQREAINTLHEFARVCSKQRIWWQLAFGSLLGAIRDNGQIPWDYDVDVFVSVTDRDLLIKALNEYLNKQYYTYCIENNPDCGHVILRLAPRGFDSRVLHVDVFFLTGLPNDKELIKTHQRNIKRATLLYKAKLFDFSNPGTASKREKQRMLIYKVLGIGKSKRRLLSQYFSIVKKYPLENSSNCCLADRFAEWYILPTSSLLPCMEIDTEIGKYPVPIKSDVILRIIYGDYEKIPDLQTRISELYKHYNYLKRYHC